MRSPNEQRGEAACGALLYYKQYGPARPPKDPMYHDTFEEDVTDLLTDILHLSKYYGPIDLQNLARIAEDHHKAELEEERSELER